MSDVDTDGPDWPPSGYFTTGNYGPLAPEVFRWVCPLETAQASRKPDGTRFLRYQTPEAPIGIGSLVVAGYLRSTSDGRLLNPANKVAGSVNFDTGVFEVLVEYDQSPGLGSRIVTYVYPRR